MVKKKIVWEKYTAHQGSEDKISDLEYTLLFDDKNVLILNVIVDHSDAENHLVVQGDIKITDRPCLYKIKVFKY